MGIGRAVALRLGEMGVNVAVNYNSSPDEARSAVALLREMGVDAFAVQADVGKRDQVERMVAETAERFGSVDILVNNAGIISDSLLVRMSDEAWDSVIATNLNGMFYCARAVAKHMAERGEGKIINVSSGFGYRGGRDNYMYCVGKGGIVQLTRVLATSLGRYGITSSCIVPGFIPTEGTDESRLTLPRGEFIPVGRVGHPREMGAVAVFLASGASDYMNGEAFVIDGGGLAGGIAPTGHAPDIPLSF